MNDYPALRFNDSGTEVTLVFSENKNEEGLTYTTKEAVFQTINVLLHTKQITLEKAGVMRQEILGEENLTPVFENKDEIPVLAIYIIKPSYFFCHPDGYIRSPLKPFLDTCTNGERLHYHITCTKGYTIAVYTKAEGHVLVRYLLNDEYITQPEAEMLYEQINKTALPET